MSTPLTLDTLNRHREHGIKSRIKRIGVEVEGAWDVRIPDYHRLGIIRDGSVKMEAGDGSGFDPNYFVLGEIPSPAITQADLEETMRRIYPQIVNHTCGLHVHVSLVSELQYQRLMDPRLLDYLVMGLEHWGVKEGLPPEHQLFVRLTGENDACQKRYMANEQARINEKHFNRHAPVHRYTFINYCYSRSGTVECRVLPMFPTVDQAIRAVREVLHIFDSFIVATAEQEERIAGDFYIPEITNGDQVSSIVRV